MKSCTDNMLFDRKHIIHPYTSVRDPIETAEVNSAKGCKIKLSDGRELIDGMSSWWACIHGYNNSEMNRAIESQLASVSHIMFGGFTHKPAIDLGKILLRLTPEPLSHIFYSDSGSVAVEVAMKMALQYWQSKSQCDKHMFMTIKKGYHGDTLHPMSVCDPVTGMHHLFHKNLPQQIFAPQPSIAWGDTFSVKEDLSKFEALLKKNSNKIAAIILEPIVQGAGAMWFYHSDYLKAYRTLCDKYDVLLIFDEIATGFGRTGAMFAMNHAGVAPDILCLGKALTGGYLSFAATIAAEKVIEGIAEGRADVFMHGPTFMGNPLACTAAIQSIKLLEAMNFNAKISRIEQLFRQMLFPLLEHQRVQDVRVLGAIGVVETKEPIVLRKAQSFFISRGVWIRPFGRLLYLMPPFIITESELTILCHALSSFVEDDKQWQ